MIGQIISHYKILEKFSEGDIGVVYNAHDFMANSSNCVELSPKGIDRSTEGSALGLGLPSTVTTLKGLNT
jgi:hypothetical protein